MTDDNIAYPDSEDTEETPTIPEKGVSKKKVTTTLEDRPLEIYFKLGEVLNKRKVDWSTNQKMKFFISCWPKLTEAERRIEELEEAFRNALARTKELEAEVESLQRQLKKSSS